MSGSYWNPLLDALPPEIVKAMWEQLQRAEARLRQAGLDA